ncbi:limbic system-associated membrane protein-like isoform X2 [Crassostrea virginica]
MLREMMEITRPWCIVNLTFSFLVLMTPISGFIHVPTFHETNRNVTVYSGEYAILKCTIENLGPKMVVWRKIGAGYPLTIGDMVFAANDKIDIQQKKDWRGLDHWNLVIKRVDTSDAGQYECQVSSAQSYVYLIQLNVLDSLPEPPAGLTLEGRNIVNFNEPINLTCLVQGETRAPEDVDWFFEGVKIVPGSSRWRNRVYITREREPYRRQFKSHLLIDNSDFSDRGTFVCRASADLVESINISVLEAPTLPRAPRNRDVTGNNKHGKFVSDQQGNSSTELQNTTLQLTLMFQLILLSWTR